MMVLEREDVNFSTQWRSRGLWRDEMKPENTKREAEAKREWRAGPQKCEASSAALEVVSVMSRKEDVTE